MTYVVAILPRAEGDFRNIFDHIEARSPSGANRWREAFERMLVRLQSHPLACGHARENDDVDVELRQSLFSTRSGLTYRVVFFVDGETVYVARIRGPGQRPLDKSEISPSP